MSKYLSGQTDLLVCLIFCPFWTIAIRKRFRQRPVLDRETLDELAVKANINGAILAVIHGSFAEIGVATAGSRIVLIRKRRLSTVWSRIQDPVT